MTKEKMMEELTAESPKYRYQIEHYPHRRRDPYEALLYKLIKKHKHGTIFCTDWYEYVSYGTLWAKTLPKLEKKVTEWIDEDKRRDLIREWLEEQERLRRQHTTIATRTVQ